MIASHEQQEEEGLTSLARFMAYFASALHHVTPSPGIHLMIAGVGIGVELVACSVVLVVAHLVLHSEVEPCLAITIPFHPCHHSCLWPPGGAEPGSYCSEGRAHKFTVNRLMAAERPWAPNHLYTSSQWPSCFLVGSSKWEVAVPIQLRRSPMSSRDEECQSLRGCRWRWVVSQHEA